MPCIIAEMLSETTEFPDLSGGTCCTQLKSTRPISYQWLSSSAAFTSSFGCVLLVQPNVAKGRRTGTITLAYLETGATQVGLKPIPF